MTKLLQQSNEELFWFPQHPHWLGDEQSQEDSAHTHLTLNLCVHHLEILWELRGGGGGGEEEEGKGKGRGKSIIVGQHKGHTINALYALALMLS